MFPHYDCNNPRKVARYVWKNQNNGNSLAQKKKLALETNYLTGFHLGYWDKPDEEKFTILKISPK